MKMICENCNNVHDCSYGSGRFCSVKCARGYSTKAKRVEINEQVSNKMKGTLVGGKPFEKGFDERRKILTSDDRDKAVLAKSIKREELYSTLTFENLPHAEQRRVVLKEQGDVCGHCGISEWLGLPITLELHHIDGDNSNNVRENLSFLCPNCHSLTDSWRRKKSSL